MNDDAKGYCVNWVAGPSAEVELSPMSGGVGYQMKYTPPFRSTIRPPLRELPVGPATLTPIKDELNELVSKLEGRSRAGTETPPPSPAPEKDVLADMRFLGDQLYTFLIKRYIQADLRTPGLFLGIGMDKKLMNYPWELMHDGADFLCLKHYLGRYIISSSPSWPTEQRPPTLLGSSSKTLKILVISVPTPKPGSRTETYPTLTEAEAEMETIRDSLAEVEDVEVKVLPKKKATFRNVFTALKEDQYQIIHYAGHAHFNEDNAYRSGLVLYDRDMITGHLSTTMAEKPPVLCFINACQVTDTSGQVEERGGEENRLNMYGLARAFLDTGAYLLGSRWKVVDEPAKEFAKKFYTSLIKEGKSIGEAIVHARKACKEAVPADAFSWASYVYYGDPRVNFQKL